MGPSQFGPARGLREHVLLLFPGALGDFLCFVPGLVAVRAETNGRVAVAARPEWLELLDRGAFEIRSIDHCAIAELYGTATPAVAPPFLAGFTEVHSWTGGGDSNFAARLARFGTAAQVRLHPFRAFRPGEHAVEYYARCLDVRPAALRVFPSGDDRAWARAWMEHLNPADRPTLIVHAGSGSPAKNWEGFAAVVEWWRRRGGVAVELVGPAEESSGPRTEADGVARAKLTRLAALLQLTTVYVGNDSGITHLAGAVGTRGIALFGPSDVDHWRPRSAHIEVIRAHVECGVCGPRRFCTHRLSIDRVIAAVDRCTSAGSEGNRSWCDPRELAPG